MQPQNINLDDLIRKGYRYALSLTHDETQAEDFVQEAMLKLFSSDRPRRAAYLYAMIRNSFIDVKRKGKIVSMEPFEDNLQIEKESDVDSYEASRLDLVKALATLRPEERESLYLSVVEGFTGNEIAELTGSPRGTVLSLIHRARIKLRTWFLAEAAVTEARVSS